jgi:hypothetical protein
VRRPDRAVLVLGAAMAVAVVLGLVWSRGLTFYADEWNYLITRHPWNADSLLSPQNGHLTLFPVLLDKILFSTIGADHHLPYRVVSILFELIVVALFFVLARRRVDELIALGASVLLLFFGFGWEILMTSFATNALMCLAVGLAALLCVERDSLRGDVGACALLIAAVASFSLGVLLALGVAVELWLRRYRVPWRRLWVSAVPIALWVAWFVWARKFHESSEISLSNFGAVPLAVVDGLAAVCGAIAGLFRMSIYQSPGALDYGIPLAMLLVAAVAARLHWRVKPSPRFIALVVVLGAYWTLIGLAADPLHTPTGSRYLFVGAVLLMLAVAEVLQRWRPRGTAAVALLVALAFSLLANIGALKFGRDVLRADSENVRATLTALEIARPHVDPGFIPPVGYTGLGDPAATIYSALDDYGSPSYTPAELARAPEEARERADDVLAQALDIHVSPAARSCRAGQPQRGSNGVVSVAVPPGGFTYSVSGGAPVQIALARFADAFKVDLGAAPGSGAASIPTDLITLRWRARLTTTAPVVICP